MQESRPSRRRVTLEKLIETGISLTLPNLTVKALAEELGVSIVAVYNNIDSLDALRTAVAEEILARWEFPIPDADATLEESLMDLSLRLRSLVHRNPGIARYLLDIGTSSPGALARIDEVQMEYSTLYELTPKQANFIVTVVAEHAVALSEMVHVEGREREDDAAVLARSDLKLIPRTIDGRKRDDDSNYEWSMRALIMGASVVIDHPRFSTY